MLAPRSIPPEYKIWNRQWRAPFGRELYGERFIKRLLPDEWFIRLRGAFSLQPNNDTRRYEYPWAYHVLPVSPGLKVIDLGGGLSGFQFVLSKAGAEVTNVDPGSESRGWPVDQQSIAKLNKLFGTSVSLKNTTLEEAQLEAESFDRVYCLSVLEHFSDEQFASVVNSVGRVLRRGGHFVITADLFLDLMPFTTRLANEWGKNFPIAKLLEYPEFRLVHGKPEELYGHPSFDADAVQSKLGEYLVGGFYPVLVQRVVLEKVA